MTAIVLPMKRRTPMKPTTVRLPEALLRAAKIHAVKTGTTLQDLVIEALTTHLKVRKDDGGKS
jgi:predicted DNA binding CopG/RHH family protein